MRWVQLCVSLNILWHCLSCVLGHSVVSSSVTPWAVACQAPLCMGFSRQEYWSGLPFCSLCLSLGLEIKVTFPVLWPWMFSKFAGLLSAALSHYHLLDDRIWKRIWKSSAGILLPPLALFVTMLPKAHLISYSRMSGSTWVITPLWLSGLLRYFFV